MAFKNNLKAIIVILGIFLFLKMIFPFSLLKKKRQTAEDIQFIMFVVYHHRYGDVSNEESQKLAEHYKKQIDSFKERLPKSVLFFDLVLAARGYTKVEVEFFPLNIQNIASNEEVKKRIKSLTNILKAQISNTQINDPKEFFEL